MIVASRTGHAVLALAALAVALMPLWASGYHLQLASTALVSAMFALSLQLLVGAAGMVSLGHAGLLRRRRLRRPPAAGRGSRSSLTLPAAALMAAAAALPVGALSLRTRGFFFLMTTLAFGQMLFFLFHDTPLGGGKDGVFVTRPALEAFGAALEVPRRSRPTMLLLLNLGVLVAMYAGLAALMRTLFGHALRGIRANENRMRALGYDTRRVKLAAFVLAGALAGVAGHMWAMTEAFVSPELLGWHRSAEGLLMILLGGLGALHGPLLGAAAFVGLGEAATLLTERRRLVEGLVILAVVLALPRGLAGLRLRLPRRRGRRAGRRRGGRAVTEAALEAVGLTRRFGGLTAVAEVSLSLSVGELHAVIGPNGAGKSTLVNLLSGELRPSAGSVRLRRRRRDGLAVRGASRRAASAAPSSAPTCCAR